MSPGIRCLLSLLVDRRRTVRDRGRAATRRMGRSVLGPGCRPTAAGDGDGGHVRGPDSVERHRAGRTHRPPGVDCPIPLAGR
jgi:hypothetical protein